MVTILQKFKWCFLGLGLLSVAPSQAGEVSAPPLTLTLVSELQQIQAGEPFTVGLLLRHAPHHHSYYKFPGIVGLPTSIEWTLPEGFQAGPIQWATPEQVDMRGHGAYGYHDDTLLLVEMTPPKELSQKAITLKGRVGYMCCSQERCTPGFGDVSLTLKVGEKPMGDPDKETLFGEARLKLPQVVTGWKAGVSQTESHFTLTVTPPKGLDEAKLPKANDLYFFSWNGWTASNEPHRGSWEDGSYHFIMPKHPYPDDEASTVFQGTLRSETGWPGLEASSLGLWVDARIQE